MTPAEASVMVAVGALAAGCLPRGAPPAGRQLLADRQASLAGLLPPTGDGVLRIFVTRPGTVADAADLFVLSVDPAGGPPTEKLLVSGLDGTADLGCSFGTSPCSGIDPRGVTVHLKYGGPERIDALTGQVQKQYASWSQNRQRFFVADPFAGSTDLTLYDIDGNQTVVADAPEAQFIGDDFFYATSRGDLMDIPPSGVPAQIATGLVVCPNPPDPFSSAPCPPFWGQITPDGITLVLSRPTSDVGVQQFSVRDPLTGAETSLPFAPSSSNPFASPLSPGGNWFVNAETTDQSRFTFFEYRTGVLKEVDVPDVGHDWTWRPGSTELWFTGGRSYSPTVWVVGPDRPSTPVAGSSLIGLAPPWARVSYFTDDGKHWFSTMANNTSTSVIQVGDADDPAAPRFDLNTADTYVEPVWQLPDQRLLAGTYTEQGDLQERTDATLFDLRTGARQVIGQRGRVTAVGQTRVMGLFHLAEERADFTVVDLQTGAQTVLAPEFTVATFAEPQGDDQLAPGTRLVYQFQARTESPYDGIWMVDCP